ncbi:MAG: chloride channel protein [Rhizobiaceae bacterium]|nr:chloride channel protein [Rhizobiaceae bacterium]
MLDTITQLPTLLLKWIEPNIRVFMASRQPFIWFIALLVGLSVSLAAILFREGIGYVQYIWLQDASEHVASAARKHPWYVILLAPAFGGLIVGFFITKLLPQRRTQSVADVIEARIHGGQKINTKAAFLSAVTTIISLGFGASAGREGPMVHLGAAISASLARRCKLPKESHTTLLACGVAAAVSASFNAPIAGVLFAHEVILGHSSKRSTVPIVISSVSGTLLSRAWFGDVAAFEIPDYQITSLWEFPAFALLGVICALVAIGFQFSLVGANYVANSIKLPLWTKPVMGGLIVGAIAIYFPEVLGAGYEATDLALHNQMTLYLLIGLLFAKTIATSITLGFSLGGGVFSPALYVGAMTGGAFGLIAAQFFPEMASSQGLYAILGMGAVAAAMLGAPISTTIIIFELTGGYDLTIALLLAVSMATGINQALHGRSFFQWQLEMRGLFVQRGPHHQISHSTKVMDFMEPLDEHENIADHEELAPHTLKSSENLEQALRKFNASGHKNLPVVDATNPDIIIAWASQLEALSYFNKALVNASEEEHQM